MQLCICRVQTAAIAENSSTKLRMGVGSPYSPKGSSSALHFLSSLDSGHSPNLSWSRHAGMVVPYYKLAGALRGKGMFAPLPMGRCQPPQWVCSDLHLHSHIPALPLPGLAAHPPPSAQKRPCKLGWCRSIVLPAWASAAARVCPAASLAQGGRLGLSHPRCWCWTAASNLV